MAGACSGPGARAAAPAPDAGASTLTQQLVKNLFLTTYRAYLRKALEYTLAPCAELVLGKQRILDLYLNVVEWGPGVYGAEAAARYYYQTSAAALTREQAARLAAVLPAPPHPHTPAHGRGERPHSDTHAADGLVKGGTTALA